MSAPERTSKAAGRGPHRLVNASTHALESFTSEGPPYAILSHVWGSEEVCLQDWQLGVKQDSEGHQKVLGTCELALQDGIDYVWVDTCCIDKTNHFELSQAINSMCAWYRDAEVCYVLLSDLDVQVEERSAQQANHGCTQEDQDPDADSGTHRMSSAEEATFVDSRYFKRGWTLQEMLAAKVVQFFAADGTYLGNLRNLANVVWAATGIDTLLLNGMKSLDDCSIPEKVSWAAGRSTTKVGDRAYSLLRLLEVSMDLCYGDGIQEFVRLQKEILEQAQGIQVLAWDRTAKSKRKMLLADRPDDFRGCSWSTLERSSASGAEVWSTSIGLRESVSVT